MRVELKSQRSLEMLSCHLNNVSSAVQATTLFLFLLPFHRFPPFSDDAIDWPALQNKSRTVKDGLCSVDLDEDYYYCPENVGIELSCVKWCDHVADCKGAFDEIPILCNPICE